MLDFKPPLDNELVIWLAKMKLPYDLRFKLADTKLEIVGDGIERFKALGSNHCVICPNHPNRDDPFTMFAFSHMVGETFNYLAAREIFDYDNGMNGFWCQRLGAYSVVRGAVDRESFKMTRHLIAAGKKKLVIFPEGEISRQNDTLMPLESGVAQMSFWALDEIRESGQAVYIMPVALKYTYRYNIRHSLESSMDKLEHELSVSPAPGISVYERLSALSLAVLTSMEKEYNYKAKAGIPVNERIQGLRKTILKNIGSYLQLNLPEEQAHLEWIRIIRNALDDFVFEDEEHLSDYQKKLHEEKARAVKGFYKDLDRVVNFISIYDGYLQEHSTQERYAHVLDRFEFEVFDEAPKRGPRLIMIDVGQPLNLLESFAAYKSNKRETIRTVTDNIAIQISTMLNNMEAKRPKIFIK